MGREYNEVVEILNHVPKEDYYKVPKNMIQMFKANMEPNYFFKFDTKKTLNEQNVSKDAKTIIAILYRDYWATEEQREKIIAKENYDKQKIEMEKQEKYGFNLKDKKQKIKENNIQESDIIENNILKNNMYMTKVKEEKWYKRILNKILSIFKFK